MLHDFIYKVLDRPVVYKLAQVILGPGAEKRLLRQMTAVMKSYDPGQRILDVGCGPQSWLWAFDLHPVGLDLSPSYIEAYKKTGNEGVVGSAVDLPFPDEAFDSVWSIGLFHHIPDELTHKSILQAIRVCKKGGYVAIFDAVMPKSTWRRPLAALIRKMDRGQHVRTQEAFEAILPPVKWQIKRFTHTYTGLELLQLVYIKE